MQKKNALDSETWIKIAKGAGIAGGAVFATYFLKGVAQLDFGTYTPLVVGITSVLINFVKEYRKGE